MWGWKTIVAGILWGLSSPLKSAPSEMLQALGGIFDVIAPMLGAVGISHKFVKNGGSK